MMSSGAVPMAPRLSSPQVQQVCQGLFPPSPITPSLMTSGRFTYRTPHDFGKKLVTLLFCTPSKGFSADFFANIAEVSQLEGFNLKQSNRSAYPVRDIKLQAADGTMLQATISFSRDEALKRAALRQLHIRMNPATLTKHPIFFNGGIGSGTRKGMIWSTGDGLEKEPPYARSYFEGGDVFHLTNRSQRPTYLIGDDLIAATHMLLRKDKWFECKAGGMSAHTEEMFHKNRGTLHNRVIGKQISRMLEERTNAIYASLRNEKALDILQEMQTMGLVKNFAFDTPEDQEKGKKMASKYLAQRKLVLDEVLPDDLAVKPDQIASIPQIAYHLDYLMTPGPHGSVFLQDYDLSVKVLQKILDQADSLQLTHKDRELLRSYITLNQVFGSQFKNLMAQAKEALENAGFTVIATPGAFFSLNPDSEEGHYANINFFNAITGYSTKNSRFYMMIPGTHMGNRLGEVLMDTYVEFLKQHCPNLAVYFIGRKADNPKDFTEAVYCLNRPTSQLGPHCLSYELEVESCTPLN